MAEQRIDILRDRVAELEAALKDVCRILEAVGYSTQFSNGQKERIQRARSALQPTGGKID